MNEAKPSIPPLKRYVLGFIVEYADQAAFVAALKEKLPSIYLTLDEVQQAAGGGPLAAPSDMVAALADQLGLASLADDEKQDPNFEPEPDD